MGNSLCSYSCDLTILLNGNVQTSLPACYIATYQHAKSTCLFTRSVHTLVSQDQVRIRLGSDRRHSCSAAAVACHCTLFVSACPVGSEAASVVACLQDNIPLFLSAVPAWQCPLPHRISVLLLACLHASTPGSLASLAKSVLIPSLSACCCNTDG